MGLIRMTTILDQTVQNKTKTKVVMEKNKKIICFMLKNRKGSILVFLIVYALNKKLF